MAGLQAVDFSAVKKEDAYRIPEMKKRKQAEVLIPHHVPLSAITHVVFRSQSSHQEAERICEVYPDFRKRFREASRLFHLPSSYVKTHFLTSDTVSRENILKGTLVPKEVFSKSQAVDSINLVMSLYGTNGTRLITRFVRDDGQIVSEIIETFLQTGDFWAWSSESISAFNPGRYKAECYLSGNLGEIRQCSVPFLVVW